jgi:hypothetical protein
MTDHNATLARVDEAVRDLMLEIRSLTRTYSARQVSRDDEFWSILWGVLLVDLILLGVAAAEAIHVLKAMD